MLFAIKFIAVNIADSHNLITH